MNIPSKCLIMVGMLSAVTLPVFAQALPVVGSTKQISESPLGGGSYAVVSSKPDDELTNLFNMKEGWMGADGAYSMPIGDNRTVWLFGDTWIGSIQGGRRVDSTMVNNTAAVQETHNPKGELGPLNFFWKTADGKAQALIQPDKRDKPEKTSEPDKSDQAESWFWPGDGVTIDGKLYVFLHFVRRKPGDSSCWGFEGAGHELGQIDNPFEPPTAWQMHRKRLPSGIEWGNAVIRDDGFIYAYGEYPKAGQGFFKHPTVSARLAIDHLANMDMDAWEYWCHTPARSSSGSNSGPDSISDSSSGSSSVSGEWSVRPDNPVILMPDGAPEMTVSRVHGLAGYFATYIRAGIGKDISIRHADRPEGPWSEPQTVYHCSQPSKDSFIYGAKAHPELATRDGALVITYCRNSPSLQENVNHPEIYCPHGVIVMLKQRH